MSDRATTLSSLEAIRAKLQQLRQPSAQVPLQKPKNHESESHSNSFDTPCSTQHSEIDHLSQQNTADSLNLLERGTAHSSVHLSVFPVKQQVSTSQGSQRLNSSSGLSQTSDMKGAGSLANTSVNRMDELADRSWSSSSHMKDSVSDHGLGNEEDIWKVLGTSNKAPNKAKAPPMSMPVHTVLGLFGRRQNQNTDEFEFKIPKPTSGCIDSQMEIGPSAGNMSTNESVTDMPSFTHPSSANKHSMRHFNSTPDIRSSAKKPSSELKISSLNLGKPMRVRIHEHPVHKLSEENEDDSDVISSFKPFNRSSHVTSGYHSDMAITTENSIPSQQAASSTHKNLSQTGGSNIAEHRAALKPVESKTHGLLSGHLSAFSAAAPQPQGMVPVAMSTPASKGPHMEPALLHRPSGKVMDSVTVNGEQYCVLKKVGCGGSAQVYMVLDASKNIRALKVVDLDGAGSEVVDGFRNEIQLLQRLQYCDSVIKMFNFELNETLNCLYVVLEFGETDLSGFFTTRAKQGQGLDPLLIKFFWREMLRAVHALHKEGVIHSDLKPANFILVAGNLKLIDFGIANTLQQGKTSVLKDSRMGTPSYMSPEAVMVACEDSADDSMEEEKENKTRPKFKVGVRSDVWSLGCILYNMVYGRTPFQHIRNNMARLQAITNPNFPIKFPHISDPQLLDVLQKCLQREVKCRPTTAELLAHPYLLNRDKEIDECHTPPPKVAKAPSATGSAPLESRQLQELLKSQLAQGSPGTTSAVSRVLDMLQKLESGK